MIFYLNLSILLFNKLNCILFLTYNKVKIKLDIITRSICTFQNAQHKIILVSICEGSNTQTLTTKYVWYKKKQNQLILTFYITCLTIVVNLKVQRIVLILSSIKEKRKRI